MKLRSPTRGYVLRLPAACLFFGVPSFRPSSDSPTDVEQRGTIACGSSIIVDVSHPENAPAPVRVEEVASLMVRTQADEDSASAVRQYAR